MQNEQHRVQKQPFSFDQRRLWFWLKIRTLLVVFKVRKSRLISPTHRFFFLLPRFFCLVSFRVEKQPARRVPWPIQNPPESRFIYNWHPFLSVPVLSLLPGDVTSGAPHSSYSPTSSLLLPLTWKKILTHNLQSWNASKRERERSCDRGWVDVKRNICCCFFFSFCKE